MLEEYLKEKLFCNFETKLLDRLQTQLFADEQHYFPSERKKQFKASLNPMYQLSDIAEGLQANTPLAIYLTYRIVFKDFINYADLLRHMSAPECFTESLCRKMVRKTRAMAMNLNGDYNFTQNTAKSGFSGIFGRLDNGFSHGEGILAASHGWRNSRAQVPLNYQNSNAFSIAPDFQAPAVKQDQSHFPLNSFQNINKYINGEEPVAKRVDQSKIKSLKRDKQPEQAPSFDNSNRLSEHTEQQFQSMISNGNNTNKSLLEAEPKKTHSPVRRYHNDLKELYDKIGNLQ